MTQPPQTPAGWYPDPNDQTQLRYFDGTQWTDNRAPANPTVGPPPAPVAAAPAKKGRGCLTWLLVGVGLLVAIVIIAAVASSGSDKPSNPGGPKSVNSGDKSAAEQVKITQCRKDPTLGFITIKGTATNSTSKRSDYSIDLAITNANGSTQLGTTIALAANVEPGQVAQWEAPSTVDYQPGAVCKVSTVTRTASL